MYCATVNDHRIPHYRRARTRSGDQGFLFVFSAQKFVLRGAAQHARNMKLIAAGKKNQVAASIFFSALLLNASSRWLTSIVLISLTPKF